MNPMPNEDKAVTEAPKRDEVTRAVEADIQLFFALPLASGEISTTNVRDLINSKLALADALRDAAKDMTLVVSEKGSGPVTAEIIRHLKRALAAYDAARKGGAE